MFGPRGGRNAYEATLSPGPDPGQFSNSSGMKYRLAAWLFNCVVPVRGWYTSPNYVRGPTCVTSNGLPGNCVTLDNNGHNTECANNGGYIEVGGGMCGGPPVIALL